MRNFKVGRLWGVLGKQQSYSGPTPPTGNKVPLNNNPMNSWDYKKSNYRRLDGRANAIQQGGAVPQDTPIPDVSPTPTPTITTTPTLTPTPSATPTPQPVLWVANAGYEDGYSTDGVNWTAISSNYQPTIDSQWQALATNGSRWSAAGSYFPGFLPLTYYSDNGYYWNSGNTSYTSFLTGSPSEIASNGSMFVIGGSSSYAALLSGGSFTTVGYSYDGITYSAGNISYASGSIARNDRITSFAYNGNMWLGGGNSTGTTANQTKIIYSYDGINWTGQTNVLFTGTVNGLAYGNGIWVAAQNSSTNAKICASTDGFNWTASTNITNATLIGLNNNPTQVHFFDNKFITSVVSISGATNHLVCYSYDGLTWFAATDTKTLMAQGPTHCSSNKTNLMICGSRTSPTSATISLYSSTNGINWSANTNNNYRTVFTGTSFSNISSNVPVLPPPNPTPTQTATSTQTPTPTLTQTPTPSGVPFDADAASYLAAVLTEGGTLNSTISAATNTLYTELKSAGLYSKLSVFYPFVGGTSASHAIMGNRTSGTTYDITWGGGMSHSVSGITGNGSSTSYGTTNFFSNSQTLGDRHYSLYSFINNTGAAYDLAVEGDNGIILGFGGNQFYPLLDSTSYFNYTASDTMGMYVVSETTLNNHYGYKNGVEVAFAVRTSASYNRAFDIGGVNRVPLTPNHGAQSSRGYNWASIGFGLTSGDTANLSTIINTFQTTLGRNTY